MHSKLKVFVDIGELLTLEEVQRKDGRHVVEADLSIVRDAIMVCLDGKVVWTGPKHEFKFSLLQAWGGERAAEFVSLGGHTVLPAFVECHTHLIFAGNRAHEFEWRMQGKTYQEIAAKGGGIAFTVEQTRQASASSLLQLAQDRTDRFLRQGVTTLEVKSGYGLNLESELISLEVARALRGPRIVTTFLGAHSRSPDFADLESYIQNLCAEILPRVAHMKLADRVDIYIEKGFFSNAQAKTYLSKARELGFALTAHVEQLSEMGGCDTVLEFQPQSIDHAVFVNDATIAKLANSSTTAVLLPASDFYLRMEYPRARHMIDQGVRVALSTDFNPGTSPTQELSFVGVLARLEMKMTLPEVLAAYTWGAASAVGLADEVGSLTTGKYCDFCVLKGSWRDLFYAVGEHPVKGVFKSGEVV